MTLTEQWKKGELPYGYYYIKTISGGEVIDRYYRDCTDYDLCEYGDVWENRFEDEIKEVLAPVPSYEEWKTVFNCANKYEVEYIECANDYENVKKENAQLHKFLEEFNALDVAKENQQLKELLKEVRDEWVIYKPYDRNQLCKRITNAIGEKND